MIWPYQNGGRTEMFQSSPAYACPLDGQWLKVPLADARTEEEKLYFCPDCGQHYEQIQATYVRGGDENSPHPN